MTTILNNIPKVGTYFNLAEAKQDILTTVGKYLRPIERTDMLQKISEVEKINDTIASMLPGRIEIGELTIDSTGHIYVFVIQLLEHSHSIFIFNPIFELVKHYNLKIKKIEKGLHFAVTMFPFKNGSFMLACSVLDPSLGRVTEFFSVDDNGYCTFMFNVDIMIVKNNMILAPDEKHIMCARWGSLFVLDFTGTIVKYLPLRGSDNKLLKCGDIVTSYGTDSKKTKTICSTDYITADDDSWIVSKGETGERKEDLLYSYNVCNDPLTGKLFSVEEEGSIINFSSGDILHSLNKGSVWCRKPSILFNGNVLLCSKEKIYLIEG